MAVPSETGFTGVRDVERNLAEHDYLADRGLATAIHLALALERPLFLEGDAGVGKTDVARVLAEILEADLIRLQCYEGIDVGQALYDWNYPKQLLEIRSAEARREETHVDDVFTGDFLIERPLLRALRSQRRTVLLIDEIDRADDEFEAFLLELLSDFAVTIPEMGRVVAVSPPIVILTSNRTRDVHDALKRRCCYHWIDHPDIQREAAIIRLRVDGISDHLANAVARAVSALRSLPLTKPPGVAESIDWARALTFLGAGSLDVEVGRDTLGWVLKHEEDIRRGEASLSSILSAENA
jgi:MoxR-like ATPase